MALRNFFSVLLTLSLFNVGTALAADGFDAVKKSGKLRVAIDATYPPMESEDVSGKPVGFDIDFANELAKRLNVKAEYIVMNWDGILAGLVSNRYDVIISSMNITPERSKQVNFVEYVKMSQLFISKKGREVKTEKDLVGKVVAVQADTTSHEFVQNKQKGGIAIKDIKAFKMVTDAFAAIKANQADVIVVDEPVGRYYAKRDPSFVISGRAMAPEPVGVAMSKKEKKLADEIQKVVHSMEKDGFMKKLSLQWFGAELGT